MAKHVLFLLLLMTVAGCESSQYAMQMPDEADLVGDWSFSAAAARRVVADFPKYEQGKVVLALKIDHTFILDSIPNTWMSSKATKATSLDSGKGTWVVGKNDNAYVIKLHFSLLNGANQDYEDMVFVGNNSAPHELLFILGDPDSDNVLQLQRMEKKTP